MRVQFIYAEWQHDENGNRRPPRSIGYYDLDVIPAVNSSVKIDGYDAICIVTYVVHHVTHTGHEASVYLAGNYMPRYAFYLEWSPDVSNPSYELGWRVRHDIIPRVGDILVIEAYSDRPENNHEHGAVIVVSVLNYVSDAELIAPDEEEDAIRFGDAITASWNAHAQSCSEAIRVFVRPVQRAGNDFISISAN